MKSIKVSASVATAAFLSGCGGGSTEMISVPAPSAFATAPTATSDTLLNGQLLPTRSYSMAEGFFNFESKPTDQITNIGYNKQTQEIVIEMDGITRTIDISGSDPDVEISSKFAGSYDPFVVFKVYQNDLNEFEDGSALVQYLIAYYVYSASYEDEQTNRSYGVIGAQTPASHFEQNTATATYSGGFAAQNWIQFNDATSRHNLYGTSSIDVNFASQTVTGGLFVITEENLEANGQVSAPRSGTFSIGASSFNNPELEFTSTLTANVPGLTLNPGATIKGGFYGDTAQEIGGALQYQGVLDGNAVTAAGPFTGTKN